MDMRTAIETSRAKVRQQTAEVSPFGWKVGPSLKAWAKEARWVRCNVSAASNPSAFPRIVGMLAYVAEWGRVLRERAAPAAALTK